MNRAGQVARVGNAVANTQEDHRQVKHGYSRQGCRQPQQHAPPGGLTPQRCQPTAARVEYKQRKEKRAQGHQVERVVVDVQAEGREQDERPPGGEPACSTRLAGAFASFRLRHSADLSLRRPDQRPEQQDAQQTIQGIVVGLLSVGNVHWGQGQQQCRHQADRRAKQHPTQHP